jgi:hypothetical protein
MVATQRNIQTIAIAMFILFFGFLGGQPAAKADHINLGGLNKRPDAQEAALVVSASASQLAQVLEKEYAVSQLAQRLQRLAGTATRLASLLETGEKGPRVMRVFRRIVRMNEFLRMDFHRLYNRPAAEVLRDWYELAYAYRDLEIAMMNEPVGGRGYIVQGKLEQSDFIFEMDTLAGIESECQEFMRISNLKSIDDMVIFDQRYHNSGWWKPAQTCAILALNARLQNGSAPIVFAGKVEATPFSIEAFSINDVRDAIAQFVPAIMGGQSADDIVMNGKRYHTSGWWKPEAVVTLLSYNIQDPNARLVASGTLEESPFNFSGETRTEVRSVCLDYYSKVFGTKKIDDAVVNGQRRHTSGWWTGEQACMMVSTLTVEQ